MKKKAEELYSEGKTVREIVKILFPDVSQFVYLMEAFSGMEWSRENFIRSLLGLKQENLHNSTFIIKFFSNCRVLNIVLFTILINCICLTLKTGFDNFVIIPITIK